MDWLRFLFLIGAFFPCLILTLGQSYAASDRIDQLLLGPSEAMPPEPDPIPEKPQTIPPVQEGAEKKANPYEDVPDVYIDEALLFEQQCETHHVMGQYYNCGCMAVSFLEKRMDLGPGASADSIIMHIGKGCIDATEAAGSEYLKCMANSHFYALGDRSPEAFCQCVANTYSKLFENIGKAPSPKLKLGLNSQAVMMCSNPAMAQRLYGVIVK